MQHEPLQSHGSSRPDAGFSLVEALVSLVVVSFIFLAIAQMIGASIYVNRAAEDITEATARAGDKMEELRNLPYDDVTPGGDIDQDVAGFFDTADTNDDGNVDLRRRWEVVDNGNSKTIRVRVVSTLESVGTAKETTLVSVVAER